MRSKLLIIVLLTICVLASITGFVYARIIKEIDKSFYLLGDSEYILEYGNHYEEAGYIAKINNENKNKDVNISSNIDLNKLGEYEIKYTLSFLNYSKELTRKVKIIDTTSPIIEVECEDEVNIMVDSNFKDCKYSAWDNYDKYITQNVKIDSNLDKSKKGNYKITYTVSDSSNNTTKKEIKVNVKDKFDVTYIIIYISKQKLYYYKDGVLELSTPVTTGRNNATKTGDFKVRNKVRDTTLKGKDYESFVQYWLGYDGNSFGIHDASWRSNFGNKNYYYNGSHGCVNTPLKAMKKLFEMVEVGTPVYIRK